MIQNSKENKLKKHTKKTQKTLNIKIHQIKLDTGGDNSGESEHQQHCPLYDTKYISNTKY